MSVIASSSAWSRVPVLNGARATLVPLALEHADALRAAAADGELWGLRYTSVPGPQPGEAEHYISIALAEHAAGSSLPFAVLDAEGSVIGSTRFYRIDPSVPRVYLGYTWYARRVQRTGLNTEAKLLLLSHAFEVLQCESVALETSHENLRSQAAILRLGATCDGILRANTRHRDGSLRDTHAFSILRSEWPRVKAGLLQKLHSHEVSA